MVRILLTSLLHDLLHLPFTQRAVMQLMSPNICLKGDFLFQQGQLCEAIHLLKSGEIMLLFPDEQAQASPVKQKDSSARVSSTRRNSQRLALQVCASDGFCSAL